MDERLKVSAAFLDNKRAFDAVNVERLLESLELLGIRDYTLKLIESFLSERRQVVRINGICSHERTFIQGVVQGSIVSPWLFVLFFNHVSSLNLKPSETILNSQKSYFMIFKSGNCQSPEVDEIVIDSLNSYGTLCFNHTIKRVNEFKYLGLILDEKLRFDSHIQDIISKTSSAAGVL